ncbi:response regulator transcription factor [Amycolatopsis sp. NPDC051903]|uniref:response regulator transcription factor n=1 Tax=Amycolatopsis sp. NPDC051903 TaxID=3363936 RepID=UPI00379B1582
MDSHASAPARPVFEMSPAGPVVVVAGPDPLTTEAFGNLLGAPAATGDPDVVVVVDGRFTTATLDLVRDHAHFGAPIVLLATDVREHSLLALVNLGVVAVLDRATTTGAALADAVRSASEGSAVLSPQLAGTLVTQVRRLQRTVLAPLGYTGTGLSAREVEILRLLADGAGTRDIAKALAYSESTVKKDLSSIVGRFTLRNRTQAVAFALRAGAL